VAVHSAPDAIRVAEYDAGRSAARLALRKLALHADPHIDPEIGSDDHGVPVWPAGALGSISHTSDNAAAVVARTADLSGLGLDIEERVSLGAELFDDVGSGQELAAMAEQLGCDLSGAAAGLFVAKEAVYKADFPARRRRYWFRDISLRPDGASWRPEGSGLDQYAITVDVRRSVTAGACVACAWW
jgi:4'-phosphopantetheinyl transferase EntD